MTGDGMCGVFIPDRVLAGWWRSQWKVSDRMWAGRCTRGCGRGQVYRMSQEECARLRESVPYVKVYRYNPKHLYPKLNGYGDNGQRKVGASCGSKYCNLHS